MTNPLPSTHSIPVVARVLEDEPKRYVIPPVRARQRESAVPLVSLEATGCPHVPVEGQAAREAAGACLDDRRVWHAD